jgi:hypothetical protein
MAIREFFIDIILHASLWPGVDSLQHKRVPGIFHGLKNVGEFDRILPYLYDESQGMSSPVI